MSENWEQLEREAEAGVAGLAEPLDVTVPTKVLERAKLMVRIAMDEPWLEDQMRAESLDPAVVRRLQSAVHRELEPALQGRGVVARWLIRNTRGLSSLAAVAMLGICIGVIHHAGALRSTPSQPGTDDLEHFLISASDVYGADPLTASLDRDLQELEAGLAQWDAERDGAEDGFQEMDESIDSLQVEPPA